MCDHCASEPPRKLAQTVWHPPREAGNLRCLRNYTSVPGDIASLVVLCRDSCSARWGVWHQTSSVRMHSGCWIRQCSGHQQASLFFYFVSAKARRYGSTDMGGKKYENIDLGYICPYIDCKSVSAVCLTLLSSHSVSFIGLPYYITTHEICLGSGSFR